MRKPFAPWIDCLIWLFLGWLAGVAATMIVTVFVVQADPSPWVRSILNTVPNMFGTGLVVLVGLSAVRSGPRVVLALRRPPWLALPWVALSSFSLAFLAAAMNTWIARVFPIPDWVNALFEQILEYQTFPQFLSVFFVLVVVAPVTEELMFRGLFLHRLWEGYGRHRAIIGSAICFGIFHLIPWQAFAAALMGIYLGWLVTRSGSILIPMAAHAFFNLVPVVAVGLADRIPALGGLGLEADTDPITIQPALLVVALATLVIGIIGTLRTTRDQNSIPEPLSPPKPSSPFPAQES